MTRTTIHAIGMSQTRISFPTTEGRIEAIAFAHLEHTTGKWNGSVRLSPPAHQDGYRDDQLEALKTVINEAVAETANLLAIRRASSTCPA